MSTNNVFLQLFTIDNIYKKSHNSDFCILLKTYLFPDIRLPKLNFRTAVSLTNELHFFKRKFFNYNNANKLNMESEKLEVTHFKSGLDEKVHPIVDAFKLF